MNIAITLANREKACRSIALVQASLECYVPFDPLCEYSPKELEPYDALSARFIRAVECSLRYFRSLEMQEFAEQSDTTRSLLNRMEKIGLISDTTQWLTMRNIRNRIVHDYLPEQTAQMFATIASEFGPELISLGQKIAQNSSPLSS